MFWFNKYNKTNFKAGGLLRDERPLSAEQKLVTATQFVAPRKIDSRDMCLRSDNQGNNPYCAAYATAGYVEFFNWKVKHYPEQVDAEAIYKEAKRIDGNNNPGTYLRSAARAAINLKLATGSIKHIDTTEMDVKFAIHQFGVVVLGLNITDEWNSVDKNGKIADFGDKARTIGGHAILGTGYSDEGIYIQNSWSENWGTYGFAILSWKQFGIQLMDAMVIVP